jgi:hypothetical protein
MLLFAFGGCRESSDTPDAAAPYCTRAVAGNVCSPSGAECSDGQLEGDVCDCIGFSWVCHHGGNPTSCGNVKNGDFCDPFAQCDPLGGGYPLGCYCDSKTMQIAGCLSVPDFA